MRRAHRRSWAAVPVLVAVGALVFLAVAPLGAEPFRHAALGTPILSFLDGLDPRVSGPLPDCGILDAAVTAWVAHGRPHEDVMSTYAAGSRIVVVTVYDAVDPNETAAVYADLAGHGRVTDAWTEDDSDASVICHCVVSAPDICSLLRQAVHR